jgi:hypothetical protein
MIGLCQGLRPLNLPFDFRRRLSGTAIRHEQNWGRFELTHKVRQYGKDVLTYDRLARKSRLVKFLNEGGEYAQAASVFGQLFC